MRPPKRSAQKLKAPAKKGPAGFAGGKLAGAIRAAAKDEEFDSEDGADSLSDDSQLELDGSDDDGAEVGGLGDSGGAEESDEDEDGDDEDEDNFDDGEDLLQASMGKGDGPSSGWKGNPMYDDSEDVLVTMRMKMKTVTMMTVVVGGVSSGDEEEDEEKPQRSRQDASSSGKDQSDKLSKDPPGKAQAKQSRKSRTRIPEDDVAPLSDNHMKVVAKDAPELIQLVENLTEGLSEVRQKIGPVLADVRQGQLQTAEGVSYLEAKHLLLLQYCSHLVFLVLLKAEGKQVVGHPVVERLVEQRAFLEKIRPIDKMLAHQVDRLLKAAQTKAPEANVGDEELNADADDAGAGAGYYDDDDALRYGPKPDQLMSKRGARNAEAEQAGPIDRGTGLGSGPGVYRPPRIAPVRRKAKHSGLLRELAEEVAGAPSERKTELGGSDSYAAIKQRQRLEIRARSEENMMMRVPLSKDEVKAMKKNKRDGMSGASMMDDFGDEVADIVKASRSSEKARGMSYGSDEEATPKSQGGRSHGVKRRESSRPKVSKKKKKRF
eukprot:gene4178-14278_t